MINVTTRPIVQTDQLIYSASIEVRFEVKTSKQELINWPKQDGILRAYAADGVRNALFGNIMARAYALRHQIDLAIHPGKITKEDWNAINQVENDLLQSIRNHPLTSFVGSYGLKT